MAMLNKSDELWFLRMHLLGDSFPDAGPSYGASKWFAWETRIKAGHKDEESIIAARYKERLANGSLADNSFFDPDEEAGEDYSETCRVTETMYAAIVVALWAEMEHFMKRIARCCATANGSSAKITHKFLDLKNAVNQTAGVDVDKCTQYSTVDAIRILNNSFKHSNGHYVPEKGKPHTEIEAPLLSKWQILEHRNKIDYSKLNIEELVAACHAFGTDILAKIITKFNGQIKII